MNGKEYIGFGTLFALYTGISQFIFNYPVNAFGMSLGVVLCGIFIVIYENATSPNKGYEVKMIYPNPFETSHNLNIKRNNLPRKVVIMKLDIDDKRRLNNDFHNAKE